MPIASVRFSQIAGVSLSLGLLLPNPAGAAVDLSALTSILGQTQEGTWARVNLNAFSDTWLPYDQRAQLGFAAPTSSVIGAWSSFAWDNTRGNLIIYGGGHGNYAGNEVYEWSGTSQMWSLASLPSQVNMIVDTNGYQHFIPVDGALNAPQSAHTYDNTLYLPIFDRYITFGGASTNSGSVYVKQVGDSLQATGPYLWDPSKADPTKVGGTTGSGIDPATEGGEMWSNRDYLTNSNLASASYVPGSFVQGASAYRTESGKDVVYISASRGGSSTQDLWKVTFNDLNDSSQDVWEVVGVGWDGGFSLGAGALDDEHNLFIRVGNASKLTIWDLDHAGTGNKSIGIDVTDDLGNPMSLIGAGMEYDPIRNRIIVWYGGNDVWYLDVPDRMENGDLVTTGWVFHKDSTLGLESPPESVENGVNGKWDYIAELDAFIAVENKVEGNVWIYKPTGWVAPVPEPETYAMLLAGLGIIGLRRLYRN